MSLTENVPLWSRYEGVDWPFLHVVWGAVRTQAAAGCVGLHLH